MKQIVVGRLLFILIALGRIQPPALSQGALGEITGAVTDPSGAVVANATVTSTELRLRSVLTATTDQTGVYKITDVPPGTYELQATYRGFERAIYRPLVVGVSEVARVDIQLKLGADTEVVEVTAEAPVLSMDTSTVSMLLTPLTPKFSLSSPELSRFTSDERMERVELNRPGAIPATVLEDEPTRPNRSPRGARTYPTGTIRLFVCDAYGRLVTGLDKENFRVFRGSEESEIVQLTSADEKASVAVIVDLASSTNKREELLRNIASQMFREINPESEFFLVHKTVGAAFISDRMDRFPDSFVPRKDITPGPLESALDVALAQVSHSLYKNRVVVVLTEVDKFSSPVIEAELTAMAIHSNTRVFGILLPTWAARVETGPSSSTVPMLDYISKITGGGYWRAADLSDTADLASKTMVILRNSYQLLYVAAPEAVPTDYEKVRVLVIPPLGLSDLTVYAPTIHLETR